MDERTPLANELRAQVRAIGPIVAIGAVVLAVAFTVARVLAHVYHRDIDVIFDDPAAALNGPLYTGAFAYLGFLSWWTAAVATGIAGGLLAARKQRASAEPLLAVALLSSLLAFDDMFQVHEGVLVRLGVPQYVSFLAYVTIFAVFLWRYRESVRSGHWLPLATFALCFGLAAIADQIADETGRPLAAMEEALELLGTYAWATYGVLSALRYLTVIQPDRREAKLDRAAVHPPRRS